jgi:hypothetical protein
MEPGACSEEPATVLYPEKDEFSQYPHILFPSDPF